MTGDAETIQLHATCVAVDGRGVLLSGPSGSGKSDLALRLIDAGAVLVADDRVDLRDDNGVLTARAPDALAGLLEVRGVGIARVDRLVQAPIVLFVDLVDRADVARLPDATEAVLAGVAVRALALHAFDASAPAKIRLALNAKPGDMLEPQ